MQLYYSGATQDQAIQLEPIKSVGGFISSSLIPNAQLSNLFPDLNVNAINSQKMETRLIVLKATSNISNLRIWTLPSSKFIYTIAGVAPAYNTTCSRYEFEKLSSPNSLPYQAVLTQNIGEENALNLGTIASGAFIGIWICRTIDATKLTPLEKGELSCANVEEQLTQLNQHTIISDSLVIDY